MKLYLSVKTLWVSSYTSFMGIKVLQQLGETGPKYP